jgi:hypothetical protein
VALFQRLQKPVFDAFRGIFIHQLHVPNVGSLAIEGIMAKGSPGQHLADLSKLAERQAQSAFVDAVLQPPQACPAHEFALLIKYFGDFREVARQVVGVFEGDEFVEHKLADARDEGAGLVGGK